MTTTTQSHLHPVALVTSSALRIGIALALSLLSGAFLFLAFPPVNFWPLMWVALVPYLVAQHRFMPRRFAQLAPTIAATAWLWPFLARMFNIPEAPVWFVNLGLFFGLLGLVMHTERKFCELTGYLWFVLQGVFSWVGFEMLRSFIPFMGTMGFAANPLAGQAWLIQPVSIFSVYGLSLLVILFNFALAQVLILLIDKQWGLPETVKVDERSTWRWAAGAAAMLVGWLALSAAMYAIRPQAGQTVRVAALQPGFPESAHVDKNVTDVERLQMLTSQARQAAAQGAQMIFTSELGLGFDPRQKHTAELQALAAETGAYLYLSYGYHDESGFHNETVLLSPSGEFSEAYGKYHPSLGEPPTLTAGSFPTFLTPYGKVGSIICMDGLFTDAARRVVANGAGILGNPSLNTTPGIGEQNWTHFVMRSIENQVPVVNADSAYTSVITDAKGRILQKSFNPQGEPAVLVADVIPGTGSRVHQALRDWLGWLALAGWVGMMVLESAALRRAKKAVS